MPEKCCPKCGGNNINFQRDQTASIGGTKTSFGVKRHGVLWWICIGWWLTMFKWMLALCTLGFSNLFFRKKNKLNGSTISANKTINRTMAVCQNCGKSWKA